MSDIRKKNLWALALFLLLGLALSACLPKSVVPDLISGPKATEESQDDGQAEVSAPVIVTEHKTNSASVAAAAEEEMAAGDMTSEEDDADPLEEPVVFEGSAPPDIPESNTAPSRGASSGAAAASDESGDSEQSAPEQPGASTESPERPVLVGPVWYWLSQRDMDGQEAIGVENPTHYSLTFNQDGTFVYEADCNLGSGGYETDGSQINLELGAVTLMSCPGDSLADQFILFLRDVTAFEFQDVQLVFHLDADSGELFFGQRSVSAAEPVETDPIGLTWQWVGFTDPATGLQEIDNPESYTFVLEAGNQIMVQADCNPAAGTYQLEDGVLSISVDPLSSDECSPDSFGEEYLRYLNAAAIAFMQDGDLYLDLKYDSGTLRFNTGG